MNLIVSRVPLAAVMAQVLMGLFLVLALAVL